MDIDRDRAEPSRILIRPVLLDVTFSSRAMGASASLLLLTGCGGDEGEQSPTVGPLGSILGPRRPRVSRMIRRSLNQRRRIRWACTRQHRRASAVSSALPGQVR